MESLFKQMLKWRVMAWTKYIKTCMELSHPGCLLLQFCALNHVFNHIYAGIIAYGFKFKVAILHLNRNWNHWILTSLNQFKGKTYRILCLDWIMARTHHALPIAKHGIVVYYVVFTNSLWWWWSVMHHASWRCVMDSWHHRSHDMTARICYWQHTYPRSR